MLTFDGGVKTGLPCGSTNLTSYEEGGFTVSAINTNGLGDPTCSHFDINDVDLPLPDGDADEELELHHEGTASSNAEEVLISRSGQLFDAVSLFLEDPEGSGINILFTASSGAMLSVMSAGLVDFTLLGMGFQDITSLTAELIPTTADFIPTTQVRRNRIDNFQVDVAAVPEPTTLALL